MKYLFFDSLNSTHTYAKDNFSSLADKTIVCAKVQTQGRGRFDRVWFSENPYNLYVSMVLKTQNNFYLANLTQYLSIIIAKILSFYDLSPQIKWPNDILINNKKICGILSELITVENKVEGVILGFGLNLNLSNNDLKLINSSVTALNIETNLQVNKKELLQKIINEFFVNYEIFLNKGFLFIKQDYLSFFINPQKLISVCISDKKFEGKIVKVNDDGQLILQTVQNDLTIVSSGDLII